MNRKIMAVAVALAGSVPALAGDLMLGPAKFDPFYNFETRYEDNIYRVPRDINGTAVQGGGVRGSWIFSNDLGVKVMAPVAENQKVNLGYDVTFENYTTQSAANNAVNQKVDVSYDFSGSKTRAKIADNYINTHDPAFNPNGTVINGALVSRQARWNNTLAASGEYYLGDKFFAGVDFSDSVNRYLDRSGGAASLSNLLNTSIVSFGAKGGYEIQPKTRAFVAVHRSATHYTEGTRRDNHRDVAMDFGVQGELSGKVKGLVQTGFISQKYDYDAGNPGRATSGSHWSVLTQLNYEPTEVCEFVLSANRSTNDAATSGSRYYISSGLNVAYSHHFGAKIVAGVNTGVQYDKYSDNFTVGTVTKSRRDDSYQVGLKVDYQVNDWLKTGASFTNNDRYSTFSREFSYRDNITGVNAKMMF